MSFGLWGHESYSEEAIDRQINIMHYGESRTYILMILYLYNIFYVYTSKYLRINFIKK